MATILEFIGFVLLSAIKFFFFYPAFIVMNDYNFWQSMAFGLSSGFVGSVTFIFAGDLLFKYLDRLKSHITKTDQNHSTTKKKLSIHRRRFLVKLRNVYGLPGIAILSPVLITIPFGCLLAIKYYRNKTRVLVYFMASIAFWSAVIFLFKETIFRLVA